MLHLIPAWLHRLAMPPANLVRRAWLRISKTDVYGVSLVGFDAEDRLLLVRHSYGTTKWSMPAGGMHRSEDPEAAIRREIHEELGVGLHDLRLVQQREEMLYGARNHVWLFTARVTDTLRPDNREVTHAHFFALDQLPEALEKRVRPRLELLTCKNLSSSPLP